MNTPTSTSPHGRFCDSRPLISVAISVACGAATASRADAEDLVQVEHRHADDERRRDDADREAHLLIDRRRADDVAGLQILRRVAGVGGAMQTIAPTESATGP